MSDVETVDQAAEPQSDLWTADSERAAIQTSDPATPVEPVDIEPEPAVAEPTSVAEQTAETSPERDANGQFKGKGRGKPRSDPQARVEQATAREAAAKEEARVAREEAARYRAELEAARKPVEPPKPEPPRAGFPAYEQWSAQHHDGQYEDYLDARGEWRLEQRLTQLQHQQTEAQRWQGHHERMTAALAADPSFQGVIQSGTEHLARELAARGVFERPGVPGLPPALLTAVLESPKSVDVYRHLLTHPADAAQLAAEVLDLPVKAAPVVRRLLESFLTSAAVVTQPDSAPGVRPSAARPPINRVGGSASATPASPDDLEFGPEYIRAENAREKKQREAGRW